MDESVTTNFGSGNSLAARGGFELDAGSAYGIAQFVVIYNLIAFWLARWCASGGVLCESANNNHIGSAGQRGRR